jgi:hypothetical protein
VAFYGNKLFQGTIITAIVGKTATVLSNFEYTLLNSFVALTGYYMAAATIDYAWMGRVRMQNMGFLVTTILFLACGYDYALAATMPGAFLFMYLASSFWGQWGPNVTTWLLPVELFPTDVRAQAHGFSAASGKLGALLATLMFGYGGPASNSYVMLASDIFAISGFFCLGGLIVTILFVPDVTNVPLAEIERRWSIDNGSQSTDGDSEGAAGHQVQPKA